MRRRGIRKCGGASRDGCAVRHGCDCHARPGRRCDDQDGRRIVVGESEEDADLPAGAMLIRTRIRAWKSSRGLLDDTPCAADADNAERADAKSKQISADSGKLWLHLKKLSADETSK